jgi:Ca2+-binding RTX toxin-like protein
MLRIDNEALWYVSDFDGGWYGPFEGRVGILAGDNGLSLKVGNSTPEDPIGVRAEVDSIERIEVSGLGPVMIETRSDVLINYTVVGTSYADSMAAGPGVQVLYGKGGADSIYGGEGNDLLYGGSGDDFISGAAGDDFISGGTGHDILDGGSGADTYHDYLPNMLGERIASFEGAGQPGGDRLELQLGEQSQDIKVTEHAGYTTFDKLDDGTDAALRVDAVGMELGVDYYFS